MKGRFYTPREYLIPKGATKVTDKQSDAVAYLYSTPAGEPAAMMFFGKQANPVWRYRYRTPERREAAVKAGFESRRASLAFKADQRKKRTSWVPDYKVGDVLHTCWGYEQTNVEYFEIVEIKGKYAILREIAAESVATGWMQGKCVPLPGQYLTPRYAGDDRGQPIRRLMQEHGIKIDDVRTAHRARSAKVAGVEVHQPLGWSSYH